MSDTHFSVLMSVYRKENSAYLNLSLKSITACQKTKPNEIVLVKDGPLNRELEEVIKCYENMYPKLFKVIALKENKGLGKALSIGLNHCSYPLVARMDSDDISENIRFEKQIPLLVNSDHDVIGSNVLEFQSSKDIPLRIKKVPEFHQDIIKYAKHRNPMNHPSVSFVKKSVQKAGSYQHFLWFEDYQLWSKMIKKGFKFYNIQTPLVKFRVNDASFHRRGGGGYFSQEMKFQKFLLSSQFISFPQYLANIFFRGMPRLLPNNIRQLLYTQLLREQMS